MQISPYLGFNGRCREAFEFYHRILGGEIVAMVAARDTPVAVQTPPDQLDNIMHARLELDGNVLMGGDAPPPWYSQPAGFSISLTLEDAAEGERIFGALAEGGTVKMAYAETFYAKGFGMLVDRFGTPWMVLAGMRG